MQVREQILIIDDEPIVRRAVLRILRHLPYELVEVSCGNDAIKLLSLDMKRGRNLIRLMCLDWLMPQGSGRDVLTWKKQSGHPANVIIMTAYGSNQIKQDIRGFTVSGVMTKPFDNIESVQEKVNAAL